jgi:hypothetical protein
MEFWLRHDAAQLPYGLDQLVRRRTHMSHAGQECNRIRLETFCGFYRSDEQLAVSFTAHRQRTPVSVSSAVWAGS